MIRFDRFMHKVSIPYDFIFFKDSSYNIQVIAIPREKEYSEKVNKKIKALNFLPEILAPAIHSLNVIDAALEDKALLEVTLKKEKSLELDRQL